jgi:hypothetical protein
MTQISFHASFFATLITAAVIFFAYCCPHGFELNCPYVGERGAESSGADDPGLQ